MLATVPVHAFKSAEKVLLDKGVQLGTGAEEDLTPADVAAQQAKDAFDNVKQAVKEQQERGTITAAQAKEFIANAKPKTDPPGSKADAKARADQQEANEESTNRDTSNDQPGEVPAIDSKERRDQERGESGSEDDSEEADNGATDAGDNESTGEGDTDPQNENEGSGDENSGGDDTEVSKNPDSQLSDVLAAVQGLTKTVDGFATVVDTKISEAIKPLNESIESVQSGLRKAEEALGGTVHSEVPDDQETQVKTQKGEAKDWSDKLDFGPDVETV